MLDRSSVHPSPQDHALAHTREQRAGSSDERETVARSGERVAPATLSPIMRSQCQTFSDHLPGTPGTAPLDTSVASTPFCAERECCLNTLLRRTRVLLRHPCYLGGGGCCSALRWALTRSRRRVFGEESPGFGWATAGSCSWWPPRAAPWRPARCRCPSGSPPWAPPHLPCPRRP